MKTSFNRKSHLISAMQFLTVEFLVYCLCNVNCQVKLGEISPRHLPANPAFSINRLGHTVVHRHLPERYTQTKCAL